MADTPDDNFMSDAIVTSVHIQQRQQAATNNSIARAERLVQMHEDQEDDGLQLALAMSLSEAESLGEPAILGVDGASSSTSVAANRGRKRRRRPAMEDHETSVLPVEEVKVLIQQKVLSLLFPEDEVNSSAAKNDSGAGMMVGALTPPWRPSRFRASHNQDDDCDDGGVSDPDSQVESFSQLCSDAKLPAPRMSHPSSSLWRLSQIGDPALKGGTNDMTGLQPAVTNLQALDQDIFVTRFMRQYILADRERIHAQAQAGGSDSTQADIHGDKVLLLLASEQKQGSATKSAGSRLSRDLKSRSTKSEHHRFSVTSLTTLPEIKSHQASNGISNDNAAPSFNFQGHDDDGDQYMSTDFLFSGSPQLEHSPVVSPVHSPEPMAAKVAPKRHSSEDVILLSSPPMLPSPSYPRRQPLLDYDEQPQDSSIIESNTSITSIRDESGDYCRLPPPLDLEQLLGFPLSQPAPRSAPMVEDHGLTPDHVRDHSIIDLSDPRRLSLIREEQEEDEEQRRRSLSSTLGLSRHARGRSRSEEPMGSASMVSTRMSRASPFLLPPPPPLSQNSQRRPNTLAGLPLLRHRAPASESHVITSASSPNPQPSSPSSVSRRALDPQDDVSTRPMSQQLPPSNSRSSRTFGRSASTTQLPSSMSTSLPSSSGEPAPSPGRSAPLTPSSRRGWRSNTGWGNGRFTRSGGVAPITAASRERAGTLVAESARVLATFVDGQEGSIASSQQSRVGVDNDDGRGAWRQQAGQGRAQDQQSTQDQQEPQMPDFEHMSVPRLRLAATSFGLRLGNKRKMVDELKAIWMRMNAPPPALSQTVAESAPQGAAVLSQGSTTLAKTNGGSSRQQPSSQVQDYNGAEEDRDDFMQEDSSLLGPDDRGMQSPFVERQNASRNPPVRADRTAGPSTRPSGSQTARGRTGSRSGRAAHNNDVVMEGGENGQDDFEQGQEGSENGNYDDDLEDDDDDEMEVFSPLDPDRMRMSMEDIILPASASQPQGSDDVGQGSSMSSSSFGRSGSASALGVLPADVDRRLYRFVASTPDLYRQCLLYKPIDLEELWERCQKADIQVSRQHLRLFLDRRGIVCFIPAHSPLSSWRKTRTKQATRGQQRGQQKQKQKQRQPRASKSSGTTARSRSSARGSRQRKRRGDDDDEEAQSQMMEDDDEDDEQPNPPASQPRPRPLARRPR
ncbi:hypothetical protein BGZ73_005817 [Actinomortierella ambigua]|nr:hypothetical protein BGZ73_005817 [Actinomortierella ambigua]